MATPAEVLLFPSDYFSRPDLVPRSCTAIRLTFIVPVYNEATTVLQVLERVAELPFEKQIIAVDDGSTDGSAHVLEQWRAQSGGLVLHQPNRGKGAAIRAAIPH